MTRKYWDDLDGRKREMIDVAEVTGVDFIVDNTGKLWVNIDGGCALRIGLCGNVAISAPNFNTTFSFIPPDGIAVTGSASVRFESKELYDAYIERERALFEEWCGSIEVTMLARNPEDAQAYAAPFVQSFWRAWQARSALASAPAAPAASGHADLLNDFDSLAHDMMRELANVYYVLKELDAPAAETASKRMDKLGFRWHRLSRRRHSLLHPDQSLISPFAASAPALATKLDEYGWPEVKPIDNQTKESD